MTSEVAQVARLLAGEQGDAVEAINRAYTLCLRGEMAAEWGEAAQQESDSALSRFVQASAVEEDRKGGSPTYLPSSSACRRAEACGRRPRVNYHLDLLFVRPTSCLPLGRPARDRPDVWREDEIHDTGQEVRGQKVRG